MVRGSGSSLTYEDEIKPDTTSKPWVKFGLSEEEWRVLQAPFLGQWFVTNVPFRYGMVGYREREHHPEHDEIVADLARGLELGFLRFLDFLDFQKVESQNRELTIQNALERVRSKASTMQASDELGEVTSVLFEQFRGLGHDVVNASIVLRDETTGAGSTTCSAGWSARRRSSATRWTGPRGVSFN